jgi:predicted O-methyltransferase YrrM
MSVLNNPPLERLLARLHDQSDRQLREVSEERAKRAMDPRPRSTENAAQLKASLSDKLVALDRDKAEFCYQLCRVGQVRSVVEIGTSFGVSTMYLASAVRDNCSAGERGKVIATEHEPAKARAARSHFAEAGLSEFIELREGDLRETLKQIDVLVDLVLVDIWIPMARPALELVAPRLKTGAVVLCDNTERFRAEYADYFAFVNDPVHAFRTVTLPFEGGLEMSVYCP